MLLPHIYYLQQKKRTRCWKIHELPYQLMSKLWEKDFIVIGDFFFSVKRNAYNITNNTFFSFVCTYLLFRKKKNLATLEYVLKKKMAESHIGRLNFLYDYVNVAKIYLPLYTKLYAHYLRSIIYKIN